jgi:hypothetical protein
MIFGPDGTGSRPFRRATNVGGAELDFDACFGCHGAVTCDACTPTFFIRSSTYPLAAACDRRMLFRWSFDGRRARVKMGEVWLTLHSALRLPRNRQSLVSGFTRYGLD